MIVCVYATFCQSMCAAFHGQLYNFPIVKNFRCGHCDHVTGSNLFYRSYFRFDWNRNQVRKQCTQSELDWNTCDVGIGKNYFKCISAFHIRPHSCKGMGILNKVNIIPRNNITI